MFCEICGDVLIHENEKICMGCYFEIQEEAKKEKEDSNQYWEDNGFRDERDYWHYKMG